MHERWRTESDFPADVESILLLTWPEIEPYYQDLVAVELEPGTIDDFLASWTALCARLHDTYVLLYLRTVRNTADQSAAEAFRAYLETVYPHTLTADQRLREKLLASKLEPREFGIPLRNMSAQAEMYRAENVPLLIKEQEGVTRYEQIRGSQTVDWNGEEVTIPQLGPVYQDPERSVRERAWRLAAQRQLADRDTINRLWLEFLDLRLRLAENAGFSDYRSYRWCDLLRFDYTPDDARRFHRAIEDVVVPAATRRLERRRQQLGLNRLRPWDLAVDPLGRAPLRPYQDTNELKASTAAIFQAIDPGLGSLFQRMIDENLLDLESRKNKGPGGFCTNFDVNRRPFIFMNAVGLHDDVTTILHEGGHAFHVFETAHLPYFQQREVGMEFAEIASMSMELLAIPYLSRSRGGFYDDVDASRAAAEQLERILLLWPRLALIDMFQHWVYGNPAEATPEGCEEQWSALSARFSPAIDWEGLERERRNEWQNALHIHVVPFYMIEYGLAQLGAVQVWANAQSDQAGTVAQYRRALALGGTRSIADLYQAAGAKLAFDAETLRGAVELVEHHLNKLES